MLFDGAHNPEAAQRLAEAIDMACARGQLSEHPIIALGVYGDKDLAGIIAALDPVARAYVALTAQATRACSEEAIVEMIAQLSEKPILKQWDQQTPIVVTGSLSLYRDALTLAKNSACV